MALLDDIDTWLVDNLNALDLDGEVYADYVKSIVSDEEVSVTERKQNVVEVLSSMTECDIQSFTDTLGAHLEAEHQRRGSNDESVPKPVTSSTTVELAVLAKEAEAAAVAAQENQAPFRSAEDERIRQRMLADFGYSESNIDEDGNTIKGSTTESDAATTVNSNKSRAQNYRKSLRDESKTAHAKKVVRDKESLAADKLRKETRKKKSVKKEKQRGCG